MNSSTPVSVPGAACENVVAPCLPTSCERSEFTLPDYVSRDRLTQLGNRSYFERTVNESLLKSAADGSSRTILLIDLDGFKAVNDSLGHAVGDSLLSMVALRIRSLLHGDRLARRGDDEFGIVCGCRTDPDTLAGRLIELVQRTYLIGGCPIDIGVSIGIASYPRDAQSHTELMRRADLALYEAKTAGRNCMAGFRPEIEVRAQARRALELDLRKALALRQLVVHYRPRVDVQTPALEAVLCWKHPVRGVLDASAFIPLAEEIGVIAPIAEWVLRTVRREAARRPKGVSISVNISSIQFETARLVDAANASLAAEGVAGRPGGGAVPSEEIS